MPLRKFPQAGRYRRKDGIGGPSILQKSGLQPREKQRPVVFGKQIIESEDAI